MGRSGGMVAALTGAALLWAVPSAHAIVRCPDVGSTAVRPLLAGQGQLESVIVDAEGRLFYTDTALKALRRIDRPGAEPVTVADGIEAPGGLAIDDRGRILVGQGDGIVPALVGNVAPAAKLLRVDPDGGPLEVVASGLQMANGIVRAADGTVYASSDVGLGIDRIAPDGEVTIRFASVFSANGLAIDSTGRYLLAAQTFQPAAIARIDLQDPRRVETYATPPADGIAGGPDGVAIDGRDRLLVTANASGEVWRVGTDRVVCAVATGLGQPSAVAFGHGASGFSAGRAFAVTFDGTVAELPGASVPPAEGPPAPAAKPRTAAAPSVVLRPSAVRVRRGRAAFTPRLLVGGRRVARRLQVGGRRARTGRHVVVRVGPRATRLVVRFTVAGQRRQAVVRLTR